MIPLFKPYMPADVHAEINEILYSGKLAFSKWGNMFEEQLQLFLETKNVAVVNSYSSALHIALSTLGINSGDEVIMSPMCCLQSTQPLATRGIKIVWADIDPNTGTLNPESVEGKITSKTKAIFHNHHMGYVGYINEINGIAKKYGLFSIDDCVDGFGGEYEGQKVGNCGSDMTVISFHAVRLPNTIEGGAISFTSTKFAKKIKMLRDLGIDRTKFRDNMGEISETYDIQSQGYGATLNEVCSFIGHRQMQGKHIASLFTLQRNNADKWKVVLDDSNIKCYPLSLVSNSIPSYWVYGMLTDNKLECIKYFRERGFYASGVHLNNNRYSVFGKYNLLKGVEEFYRRFFALPSGWWVDEKQIKLI